MARSVPRSAHGIGSAIVAGLAAVVLAAGLLLTAAAAPQGVLAGSGTYRNPLEPVIPGDGIVESCADPSVLYGQEGEGRWYLYCTTDPLNSEDRVEGGGFNFRLIPMLSSTDLVNWEYEGDAFETRPSYATATAGLWAPEITYRDSTDLYYLYYTVTDTTFEGGGSAIGVATSETPLGPWTHADAPVIEPHAADCCPGSRRWVFDPDVLQTAGTDYIYYGSYFGGISVRTLSEDGLTSTPIDDGDPTSGRRTSPSRTSSRVPRSSGTRRPGSTTSSPPPRTAAAARSPGTASSSAAPRARRVPSSIVTGSTSMTMRAPTTRPTHASVARRCCR